MGTSIKLKLKKQLINTIVDKSIKQSLQDCATDLENMASASAPIDFGTLEGSGTNELAKSRGIQRFDVKFSAIENGFNYAHYVHENHPIGGIGDKTKLKPNSQSGITGQTYPSGGNFLKGPFDLNIKGYKKYIESELKSSLKK